MVIKVDAHEGEHFLTSFAQTVGSRVENSRVDIPLSYGSGYVQGFVYGNQLRLIVRHYTLNETVVIKRQERNLPSSMILLSFQNILPDTEKKSERITDQRRLLPSVTISTKGLDAEVFIPGRVTFNAINLAIEATYLRQLVPPTIGNTVLKTIIDNSQPLVFEQLVSIKLQEVAVEIVGSLVAAPLQTLFYKVKSEELIYYLFTELMDRQTSTVQALNRSDVKRLYAVRDQLIGNLAAAPTLRELAASAGMSQSKLKRLFMQIFGDSVYHYYQTVRMKEAAYLLKQKQQSVSEVGYALGFTNLSHFTRVFEEHTGMKPKKVFDPAMTDNVIGQHGSPVPVELLAKLPEVNMAAKTTLLNEGEVATTLYFIREGCLRVYFNDDGREITTQFFFEGQAATALESFLTQTPSPFTIESIEPCQLAILTKANFDRLMRTDQSFQGWFYQTALQKLIDHTNRLLSFIKDTPQTRYRQLADQYPALLKRIPQHYIASYLGVTPVSLSRIKNRK